MKMKMKARSWFNTSTWKHQYRTRYGSLLVYTRIDHWKLNESFSFLLKRTKVVVKLRNLYRFPWCEGVIPETKLICVTWHGLDLARRRSVTQSCRKYVARSHHSVLAWQVINMCHRKNTALLCYIIKLKYRCYSTSRGLT